MIQQKTRIFHVANRGFHLAEQLTRFIDQISVDGWYCHQIIATTISTDGDLISAVIIFYKNII